MTVSRGTLLGLALGSLASVLWGSVNVCARYLVDSRGLDPMFVASVRFCSGALVALGFMILTGRGGQLRAATRELPLLLLLGAIGIFAMGSMVFLSARYTASVNSAVILNANPLFIALLAPLAGERVPWLRRLGVLLLELAGLLVLLGVVALLVPTAAMKAQGVPENITGSTLSAVAPATLAPGVPRSVAEVALVPVSQAFGAPGDGRPAGETYFEHFRQTP